MLDTAKLKNRKSTLSPSKRGRDVAKELTLKVNTLKGIHDRFLRDQVYRESQLASCVKQHQEYNVPNVFFVEI